MSGVGASTQCPSGARAISGLSRRSWWITTTPSFVTPVSSSSVRDADGERCGEGGQRVLGGEAAGPAMALQVECRCDHGDKQGSDCPVLSHGRILTRAMPQAPRPFRLQVSESALSELKERLARTRWPDEPPLEPWSTGTSLAYAKELCEYWRSRFDWRAWEARLNAFPQFTAAGLGHRAAFCPL